MVSSGGSGIRVDGEWDDGRTLGSYVAMWWPSLARSPVDAGGDVGAISVVFC